MSPSSWCFRNNLINFSFTHDWNTNKDVIFLSNRLNWTVGFLAVNKRPNSLSLLLHSLMYSSSDISLNQLSSYGLKNDILILSFSYFNKCNSFTKLSTFIRWVCIGWVGGTKQMTESQHKLPSEKWKIISFLFCGVGCHSTKEKQINLLIFIQSCDGHTVKKTWKLWR